MNQEARKVVVLPCSGIGKVYGAIARETTYELMDRVRPGVVVTTCLPLLVIDDPEALRLFFKLQIGSSEIRSNFAIKWHRFAQANELIFTAANDELRRSAQAAISRHRRYRPRL